MDARLRGAATEDQIETQVAFTLADLKERNADIVSALLHELDYALFDYNNYEAGKHPISRAVYNTLALPLPR